MDSLLRILSSVLSTSIFASLLGVGLAVASKKFQVNRSPVMEKLLSILPGFNCGVCGYSGCEAYATALAEEKDTEPGRCCPGGSRVANTVSQILGIESVENTKRMVAHLACQGGDGIAAKDFLYQGYADCEAVKIHFEGDKGCKHGCLGLGSCVRACPVHAISYSDNGLVHVDQSRCIACRICVTVCPSKVMKMIPADAQWFVACNSTDKAKDTKALCSMGCIGCRICERKFPDSGFTVANNLASLTYKQDKVAGSADAAEACPSNCILRINDGKEAIMDSNRNE